MDNKVCVNRSEHLYEVDYDQPIVDLLNRSEIVNQLFCLLETLSKNKSSCTFALNGVWGSGKTFVLNMLEEKLVSYKDGNQFLVFHYNCWKYDYYSEPLIAIVSAMQEGIDEENPMLSTKVKKQIRLINNSIQPIIKSIGLGLIKNKFGVDIDKIATMFEKANEAYKSTSNENQSIQNYNEYLQFNKSLKNARNELQKLAENNTLVIIVDELDRCLPNYAITVLERLHHLFDNLNNCEVVLSVDCRQLKNTIKNVFGESTETDEYLKKFIDFTIELNKGEIRGVVNEKYSDYFRQFDSLVVKENFDFNEYFHTIFYGIDIRTQEKLVNKANMIHKLLFKDKCDYSLMCIEILIIVLKEYYKIEPKYYICFMDPILLFYVSLNSKSSVSEKNDENAFKEEFITFLDSVVDELGYEKSNGLFNKLNNQGKWFDYYLKQWNIDFKIIEQIFFKRGYDIQFNNSLNKPYKRYVDIITKLIAISKSLFQMHSSSMINLVFNQLSRLIYQHDAKYVASNFSFTQEECNQLNKERNGMKEFMLLVNTIH